MLQNPFRLPALFAFLLILAACTRDVDTGPITVNESADDTAGGSTDEDTAGKTCNPDIHQAMTRWESAGFSGTVAIDGGEPYADQHCRGGYGFADRAEGTDMTADTTFSIGSITKAVTAAAIGGLAGDGLLDFDDPVSAHLPNATGPAAEVTIKQLLLHTGGLTGSHGRDDQPLTRTAAIDAIGALDRAAAPGEEFLYSNAGYGLLALVIDELTGGYRDHLREHILVDGDGNRIGGFWNGEPAAPEPRAVGITDGGAVGGDGTFAGPHWGLDGSGGVAMTTPELADWTRAFFNGRIIDTDAVAALLDLRFDQGDGTAEVPGWVSVSADAFGEPVLGTSGGGSDIGHEMTVAYLSDSDRVFVFASNDPAVRAEEVLQQMIGSLVAGQPPTGPAVAEGVDPELATGLVGEWEFGNGARFEVAADTDAVRVTPLDGPAMELLLPVPNTEDAAAHEQLVLDVIDGATEEGRNERRLLEEANGPIQSIDVLGTWFAEFEYRTLLDVGFESEQTRLWLALDGAGGIAAAEVGAPFPSLRFLPRDDGSLAPIDQVSVDLGIRITVEDMQLEVHNNGTTETATRTG